MISHSHRFLFIHVPKTGGNSIQNELRKFSEDAITSEAAHQDGVERFEVKDRDHDLSKHATMADYKRAYGWKLWRYRSFATMRNPYAKAVSLYFSPHAGREAFNAEEFARVIAGMPTLESYVGKPERLFALIRFENLSEDFATVARKLKLDVAPLEVRNKGKTIDYRELYDAQTKAIIAERHAREITLGGYSF